MILGFIFSILSVTYTVTSSNSVEVSGEAPVLSSVTYSRSGTTGQKGQMTAGNSTTLQLSGWNGCVVDSVVLSMRSNTSQGAGSLSMHVGDNLVWAIADADFANVKWNGEFTTNWVDIRSGKLGDNVHGEDIKIYIEASKNSLYINSYTIYYTLPDPVAHEVCFISGLSDNPDCVIEDSVGSGVLLPNGVDTLDWYFIGWSENEVTDVMNNPSLWKAGERYFPNMDCTLWAVYSDHDGVKNTTDCTSGDYVIASALWNVALIGGVENGEVATTNVVLDTIENGEYQLLSSICNEMIYHVDFMTDSTLVIEHVSSETMVGYRGTKLSVEEGIWKYRILGDGSFSLYYPDGSLQRMLWIGYNMNGEHNRLVGNVIRVNEVLMQKDGLILFPVEEVVLTSWPFGKLDGLEDVFMPNNPISVGEYTICFGNYLLRIRDGKKELIVR